MLRLLIYHIPTKTGLRHLVRLVLYVRNMLTNIGTFAGKNKTKLRVHTSLRVDKRVLALRRK